MELYLDYNRKSDIHGTVLYPAPMIAPLQFDVLNSLITETNIKILDPFHGSGISLFEASKISSNITIYGFDINPFANLITKAKLNGVDDNIFDDINLLKKYIYEDDSIVCLHYFDNIDKWYKKEIIFQLSKVRKAIQNIDSKKNRIFFWTILSNVIRRYSNTRSSTYKLHIKTDDQIESIKSNLFENYFKEIENSVNFYKLNIKNNFTIKKTDSLIELTKYQDDYFDIIITSPPYGDNGTTVPYGQFSTLSLFWIDSIDLELEGWELDNYSTIDSNSMGGTYKRSHGFTELQSKIMASYFVNIKTKNKKDKVEKFFYDYFIFLDEIIRISKNYIILTLGNRTVDGVKIDLTKISKEYIESFDFICNNVIERELQNKRIPRKTSNVKNKAVNSINKEYLLIMEKEKYKLE